MGPYCSADSKSILLGTFLDEMCTYPAPVGTYEQFNCGNSFLYASENLVDANCLLCLTPGKNDNNGRNINQNGNNNYNYNCYNNKMCEPLYEDADKRKGNW